MLLETQASLIEGNQGARVVSLYSVVSRGVAGRLGQRPIDDPAQVARLEAVSPSVLLQSASMRLLEAGLALTAIATAILIGVGR
jgi:hypothetical protein